jgi:hypothetical protein
MQLVELFLQLVVLFLHVFELFLPLMELFLQLMHGVVNDIRVVVTVTVKATPAPGRVVLLAVGPVPSADGAVPPTGRAIVAVG